MNNTSNPGFLLGFPLSIYHYSYITPTCSLWYETSPHNGFCYPYITSDIVWGVLFLRIFPGINLFLYLTIGIWQVCFRCHFSEHSIVAARASVMIYDDGNKRWVPSGSSTGLSKVHIYHHSVNNTFRVVGRKLQDHEVRPIWGPILQYTLPIMVVYLWQVADLKLGLWKCSLILRRP